MLRTIHCTAIVWMATAPAIVAGADYSIQPATTAVPKELKEAIAKLLSDKSVQLQDAKGTVITELWFRQEIPAKATPAQIKNGLTYRELDETVILGAVRFNQPVTDYRKQKIKPGVYTLRLGFQPMDGDHMGTAPYPEFCLLVTANDDQKPDLMSPKDLQELSSKASGTAHPAVFLLYPNNKSEPMPKLVDKGSGTWVLNIAEPVKVGDQKTALGLGLTLIGHTEG
jgi:hypothetical protein